MFIIYIDITDLVSHFNLCIQHAILVSVDNMITNAYNIGSTYVQWGRLLLYFYTYLLLLIMGRED